MRHEHRVKNFRELLSFFDLSAPPAVSTLLLGRVRRTRGSCSNCRRRPGVALFTRGSQICALCIHRSQDTFTHPATRMALIRQIRRLKSA